MYHDCYIIVLICLRRLHCTMSSAASMRGFSAATDKTVMSSFMRLDQPDDRVMCEYVWIDGTGEGIRTKCKTLMEEPQKPEGQASTPTPPLPPF